MIRGAAARNALGTLLVLALTSGPAVAGTEEFSTFDLEAQEEDDESLLDHLLTRPPLLWRDEWERAPQALRSSQGCLTSGQWFIDTRLKLRTPMGRRASFGFDLVQDESDRTSYTYTDFSFRFPLSWGTPGAMFRPLFDKSRQDFALFFETGPDTLAWYGRATFTFEDVFNNLWAFRQTRVGETSEPYERHPYEPGLELAATQPLWRARIAGRWLTPSRKRLAGPAGGRRATLWGSLGTAEVEVGPERLRFSCSGTNHQARGTEEPVDGSTPRTSDYRRQWWVETAVRGAITERLAAELRWLYQSRSQDIGAGPASRTFDAADRVLQLETTYDIADGWMARLGLMHDRVGIGRRGPSPPFSYGSRTESRAYIGLAARFGRVSLHGVEGIELDHEPYEVWLVHDKAFLHLQTTF
jgi:hypothetical protein